MATDSLSEPSIRAPVEIRGYPRLTSAVLRRGFRKGGELSLTFWACFEYSAKIAIDDVTALQLCNKWQTLGAESKVGRAVVAYPTGRMGHAAFPTERDRIL